MSEATTTSNGSQTADAKAEDGQADQAQTEKSTHGAELGALVDRLEGRVKKLLDETGRTAVEEGKRRIEENPLTAVLIALGVGLLLGLIFGGRRGR